VTFTRQLIQAAWMHGRAVPYTGCYPPLYNARVMDSDFASSVADVLGGRAARVEGASSLREMGFEWWAIHLGTGTLRPDAESRLVTAARATFPEIATGNASSLLFELR